MKSDSRTCESRDILSSRWRVFIPYLFPAIAIVVVGPLDISSGWRAVVWTVALATMGMACIVNALRCGRVHCFLTGPFLLRDGPRRIIVRSRHAASRGNGWNPLGLMTLIGAIALWCLPETFLGRYRKSRADNGNAHWSFLPVCQLSDHNLMTSTAPTPIEPNDCLFTILHASPQALCCETSHQMDESSSGVLLLHA